MSLQRFKSAILAVMIGCGGLGLVKPADAGVTVDLDYSFDYAAAGSPGTYLYNFTLKVDTSTGPLVTSGGDPDGWGSIVFGDVATGTSPLADFVGIPSSISNAAFTGFGTNPANDAPVLTPPFNVWYPGSDSETLTWSGYSNASILSGLLFSIYTATGTANNSDVPQFKEATLTSGPPSSVPEPSSFAMMGIAASVGLLSVARRRRAAV